MPNWTVSPLDLMDEAWFCDLTVNKDIIAHGRGSTSELARKAAITRISLEWHSNGTWQDLLKRMETIVQEKMLQEVDIKAEIYNYCICVLRDLPTFQMETVLGDIVKVKIAMRDVRIDINRNSNSVASAMYVALTEFKKRLALLQPLSVGQKIPWAALNTNTVEEFLEFHTAIERHEQYSVKIEEQEYKGITQFLATISSSVAELQTAHSNSAEDAVLYARLRLALKIVKEDPSSLIAFVEQNTPLNKNRPRTVELSIPPASIVLMQKALISLQRQGLTTHKVLLDAVPNSTPNAPAFDLARVKMLTEKSKELNAVETKSKYTKLPVHYSRKALISAIRDNPCSIVMGGTGCGKSTQIPQFILDDAIRKGEGGFCNIICTQPRKIAATSLATRVAGERKERIGESVGYLIKGDVRPARAYASITYCTTAILVERLKRAPEEVFAQISHIVIDEVHERNIDTDLLMLLLKRHASLRKDSTRRMPKIVLMSATFHASFFSQYFEGMLGSCPIIQVSGQTFPVTSTYLEKIVHEIEENGLLSRMSKTFPNEFKATQAYLDEELVRRTDSSEEVKTIDWQSYRSPDTVVGLTAPNSEEMPVLLVAAAIIDACHAKETGVILVFLPGYTEISQVDKMLKASKEMSNAQILPLHSSLTSTEQAAVFSPLTKGIRRVVLSTNIAETSVTIPDVSIVIDCGMMREMTYDPISKVSRLQHIWESQSNAKQRAGRAGRTKPGQYHALFTFERYKKFKRAGDAEVLRADLTDVALTARLGCPEQASKKTLLELIEAPPSRNIDAAVLDLSDMGALNQGDVTGLGFTLSRLPLAPVWAKVVVLGLLFKCLDAAIVIASATADGAQIFSTPYESNRAAARLRHKVYNTCSSDHIALYNAYCGLREAKQQGVAVGRAYAEDNCLNWQAFLAIERSANHTERSLRRTGLLWQESTDVVYGGLPLNTNINKMNVLKGILVSIANNNLAYQRSNRIWRIASTGMLARIPHSASGLATVNPSQGAGLCTFTTLTRSRDGETLSLTEATAITHLTAILFASRVIRVANDRLEINGCLRVKLLGDEDMKLAKLLLEYRKALDRVLLSSYNELKPSSKLRKVRFADNQIREKFITDLAKILEMKPGSVTNTAVSTLTTVK